MRTVTVRELRNANRNHSPEVLIERRRNLPRMSLAELRADMDTVLDGSLYTLNAEDFDGICELLSRE